MSYSLNQTNRMMVQGWTRIDMLLALYDRAITAVHAAGNAADQEDQREFSTRSLEAQRYLLALHSGLDLETEVAANVGRMLAFVAYCIEERRFGDATRFLERLRESYAQIRQEAVSLEQDGKIPHLPLDQQSIDIVA